MIELINLLDFYDSKYKILSIIIDNTSNNKVLKEELDKVLRY